MTATGPQAPIGPAPASAEGASAVGPPAVDVPKEGRGGIVGFLRSERLGAAAAAVILLIALAAIFAPAVAPHDPLTQDRRAFMDGPSSTYLFGTDDLGRDIFSRLLHGARISLYVGGMTVLLSLVLGTTLGLVSGYFGGFVDTVIQRFVDAVLAVPGLILALFIAALLGPSTRNVILALTVLETPRFARIARGETVQIRRQEYVEAAKVLGARPRWILLRHGVPNMAAPLVVVASLVFGQAIVAEAGLSFLGIGTPPPNPSWGLMLSQASRYLESAPWMVIFPGATLSVAVLAFNIFGDALRDYFDPKLIR
ncbi:MAG TPA: ABC transporter permease [Acidimicrobiales bacterium]|nr:ABC transporter permease [Acidimicrobiales bacterium]